MKDNMPRTPFSTPLSGSARAVELRLKNIFSGPKKRPPALFLAAVFAVCLFCGNLVSCNVVETKAPDTSQPEGTNTADGSQSVALTGPEGDSSTDGWERVRLENGITGSYDWVVPPDFLTEEQWELLEHLPVDELPKEAVDLRTVRREDFWRDMLLPVAYDEELDVTLYFVVAPSTMPDIEPGASPDLGSLVEEGVVLRQGDRARHFYLESNGNLHFAAAPMLAVDDFNGDGQSEAAVSLIWGWGTGCWCECLYIFYLEEPMGYCVPNYVNIFPLRIDASPDGEKALITSGDRELKVDLTRLGVPFQGTVEVGNQIRFQYEDGQLICDLGLDFSCDTLGYLAGVKFPIVLQHLSDGSSKYVLGPAISLYDVL